MKVYFALLVSQTILQAIFQFDAIAFTLAKFFPLASKKDLRRPVVWRIATMDNGAIIYNRDPPGDFMPNE